MLRKLKNLEEREEGFTLIELLVVVIIIGILAAIAIPVFLNQREKAFRSAVKGDLRNAATQLESSYTDTYDYRKYHNGSTADAAASKTAITDLLSTDVTLTTDSVINQGTYCLGATHTGLATADPRFFMIQLQTGDAAAKVEDMGTDATPCTTP